MTPLAAILAAVVLGIVGVWIGSHWFEESSDLLSRHYRLPKGMQGAVVAAVGSSMPELSSVVLATLVHGEFDLGVASIVGSAIFNILVIPSVCVLVGGDQRTTRELIYRDAQFYLISVAVLLISFSLAVIYAPVPGETLVGSMGRPLAAIPLGIYLLYLFLQHQDMVEDRAGGMIEEPPEGVSPAREWARLLGGLAIILLGVEGLVWGSIGLGKVIGCPSFLWGLTIVAAGTSLPDAFVSIQAAKKDDGGVVSISNVLGSNIFDLLVAVPAGVMIAGSTPIDFKSAAPMMAILTFATIAFFTFLRTDRSLGRREAWAMLLSYAAFVVWLGLETTGVTALLR